MVDVFHNILTFYWPNDMNDKSILLKMSSAAQREPHSIIGVEMIDHCWS